MLDRRSSQDDNRGLQQGVTDNIPTETAMQLLFEVSSLPCTPSARNSSMPLRPSLLSHHIASHLNYPPMLFLAAPEAAPDAAVVLSPPAPTAAPATVKNRSFLEQFLAALGFGPKEQPREDDLGADPADGALSPMKSAIPCDLHLVSLKVHRPEESISVSLMSLLHLRQDVRQCVPLVSIRAFLHKATFCCSVCVWESYIARGCIVLQASAVPPFGLLLQRHGWDCSFTEWHRVLRCPKGQPGTVSVKKLFSLFETRNVTRWSLNLLDEEETSIQTDEQKHDTMKVYLRPMEVAAYRFLAKNDP